MELVGRRAETEILDRLLAAAAVGAGSGLVLWGEPGIGKTALLDYTVSTASGSTVLRCRGTRMEAGLAFAALHQLLWPIADRLDRLPPPQAGALRGVLGLSDEKANRFLIGAAVLSLVSDLGRERPVIVVVDDAQWIDEATAHSLGFVARRVRTDPVLILLTGHCDPASGPWEGLPALEIRGLDDEAARSLVSASMPGARPTLIDEVTRAAGGNPLALQELPTLDRERDDMPLPPSGDPVPIGPGYGGRSWPGSRRCRPQPVPCCYWPRPRIGATASPCNARGPSGTPARPPGTTCRGRACSAPRGPASSSGIP